MSKHEAMDPNDFHHVSMHRGCRIGWNMENDSNASPRLPQHQGHSGHVMSHLSCLNDNVTLTMSETKSEDVVLGSPQTKLSILVSTMRDEGCSEKLIKDTCNAYVILTSLRSTSDQNAMEELACLEIVALEKLCGC